MITHPLRLPDREYQARLQASARLVCRVRVDNVIPLDHGEQRHGVVAWRDVQLRLTETITAWSVSAPT